MFFWNFRIRVKLCNYVWRVSRVLHVNWRCDTPPKWISQLENHDCFFKKYLFCYHEKILPFDKCNDIDLWSVPIAVIVICLCGTHTRMHLQRSGHGSWIRTQGIESPLPCESGYWIQFFRLSREPICLLSDLAGPIFLIGNIYIYIYDFFNSWYMPVYVPYMHIFYRTYVCACPLFFVLWRHSFSM